MRIFESEEQKLEKEMKNFEVHTTDFTVKRAILSSKFVQHVGINSYTTLKELVSGCKNLGFNGIVGVRISPSGGLGGAQAIIVYGNAVKFE